MLRRAPVGDATGKRASMLHELCQGKTSDSCRRIVMDIALSAFDVQRWLLLSHDLVALARV